MQQYHSSSVHPQPLDGHILKDPHFSVRLRLFSEALHDVVYRFQAVFTGTTDEGFYVYGQIARFIHSTSSRCLVADSVPELSDWESLLKLDVTKCTKVSPGEFGVGSDFRKELLELRAGQSTDLLLQARDFYFELVSHFITSTRHVAVFSKGLAAFDPNLLFREDSELASECFLVLYSMFQQRGWVLAKDKSNSVAEYNCFVRDLQRSHVTSSGLPLPIVDAVNFFASLPCLVNKPLVNRIFRLSCLCLPLKSHDPPTPSLGLDAPDLSSEAAKSLIRPLYSFLRQAETTFAFDYSTESLSECEGILPQGPSLYSNPDYSPWDHVEFQPQEEIYDRLLSLYQTVRSSSSKSKDTSAGTSLVGVSGEPPAVIPALSGSVARTSLRNRSFRKKSPAKKV